MFRHESSENFESFNLIKIFAAIFVAGKQTFCQKAIKETWRIFQYTRFSSLIGLIYRRTCRQS
jgi:hypothetical protein